MVLFCFQKMTQFVKSHNSSMKTVQPLNYLNTRTKSEALMGWCQSIDETTSLQKNMDYLPLL